MLRQEFGQAAAQSLDIQHALMAVGNAEPSPDIHDQRAVERGQIGRRLLLSLGLRHSHAKKTKHSF